MILVNTEIRTILKQNGGQAATSEFSDDESLLEAGIIDSFSMVDLISQLEKTYDIKIDEDDMMPENFDSVNAIAEFVQSKK